MIIVFVFIIWGKWDCCHKYFHFLTFFRRDTLSSEKLEALYFNKFEPITLIYHKLVGTKLVVPHWHKAIEVTYIAKGNPGFLVIEGATFQLYQGDVFVINSKLLHGFNTKITAEHRILTILIDFDWLTYFYPEFKFGCSFKLLGNSTAEDKPKALQRITSQLNNLLLKIEGDDTQQLELTYLSMQIIAQLVTDFEVNVKVKSEVPDTISQIISEIQDQFMEPLKISDLAEKYSYSYAYFSKYFKKYVGVSPKVYLTSLRIQKSVDLINESNLSLIEIAQKVGFSDEKSFYKAFFDSYQTTPGRVRASIKK